MYQKVQCGVDIYSVRPPSNEMDLLLQSQMCAHFFEPVTHDSITYDNKVHIRPYLVNMIDSTEEQIRTFLMLQSSHKTNQRDVSWYTDCIPKLITGTTRGKDFCIDTISNKAHPLNRHAHRESLGV